jgi:hypothetical protein
MLLAKKLVKAHAPLLSELVDADRLRLRRRVGPPLDVAQEKAPGAVLKVLKVPLAKLEILREKRRARL